MAENGKLPPHNVEAEEAVLGSLLVDPESIAETAILRKSEAFYREKNQWVYDACLALYDRTEAINQITVAQELATQGRLEAVGASPLRPPAYRLQPAKSRLRRRASWAHWQGSARA